MTDDYLSGLYGFLAVSGLVCAYLMIAEAAHYLIRKRRAERRRARYGHEIRVMKPLDLDFLRSRDSWRSMNEDTN